MKNTNTGETRKTVVPYGKKKERPLDYGHYKIEKIYQEGVNNEEFTITPEISEFSLNQANDSEYGCFGMSLENAKLRRDIYELNKN